VAAPALPGESSCEAPKDLLSGSWKAAGRRCGRMGVGRARRATVGPASLFKMTREPANMADSDSITRPVDRIRLSAGSGRFLACRGPDQIRPRAHETGRRPILRCESAAELFADNFDRRFVPARLRSRSFVASMLCRKRNSRPWPDSSAHGRYSCLILRSRHARAHPERSFAHRRNIGLVPSRSCQRTTRTLVPCPAR
jgi:hypothetical protein